LHDVEHYRALERLYLEGPFNQSFNPTIQVGEGTAEITISVTPDHHTAGGSAHGALYFKALNDAAFFAASSLIDDVFVVTTHFTVYFIRPVIEGSLVATGKVVSRTPKMLLAEATLTDEKHHGVGRGNGAFIPSQTALSPDLGYSR